MCCQELRQWADNLVGEVRSLREKSHKEYKETAVPIVMPVQTATKHSTGQVQASSSSSGAAAQALSDDPPPSTPLGRFKLRPLLLAPLFKLRLTTPPHRPPPSTPLGRFKLRPLLLAPLFKLRLTTPPHRPPPTSLAPPPTNISRYYTKLYYTIIFYTILYYTILYYTILYYIILYYPLGRATLFKLLTTPPPTNISRYYTKLYHTRLFYTVLCYTILYYTILSTGQGAAVQASSSSKSAEHIAVLY
jgi:hypothetical protein